MSEEQDPLLAESWYQRTIKGLLKARDAMALRRKVGEDTPVSKIVAWKEAVERADRAKDFLEGDFWERDLGPRMREFAALKPWKPGDPRTLEEVAAEHLVASGKALLLEQMNAELSRWIKSGEEAQKALVREDERRKAIAAARASAGV